ncbi:DUF4309 domain-containing protein [Alkalihalobacterium bogoriense]|uniref:DUF4309 domain-containing protein n=1 Tax=Alkalihalobacterium bogoriense TaxID=246272 RepID=UPI000479D4F0|nr:DUF4309 domain-containing protein [Alkalihalobacterium bogoriense]
MKKVAWISIVIVVFLLAGCFKDDASNHVDSENLENTIGEEVDNEEVIDIQLDEEDEKFEDNIHEETEGMNKESEEANETLTEEVVTTGENNSKVQDRKKEIMSNLAEQVSNGVLGDCKYGLSQGLTGNDIIDKMGKPDKENFLDGGYLLKYNQCFYHTPAIELLEGELTAISWTVREISSITRDDIINSLGEPKLEEESILDANVIMYYEIDDYKFSVYFPLDSEEVSYFLIKNLYGTES